MVQIHKKVCAFKYHNHNFFLMVHHGTGIVLCVLPKWAHFILTATWEILQSSFFSEKETEAQRGSSLAQVGECRVAGWWAPGPRVFTTTLLTTRLTSWAGSSKFAIGRFLPLKLLLFSEGCWVHIHSRKGLLERGNNNDSSSRNYLWMLAMHQAHTAGFLPI